MGEGKKAGLAPLHTMSSAVSWGTKATDLTSPALGTAKAEGADPDPGPPG